VPEIALAVVQPPLLRKPKPCGIRAGKNRLSRLTHALDIQDAIARAVNLLEADLQSEPDRDTRARIATAMASSGRSYQALQTVVFALRGHGVPKPVEARNATPRAKQRKPVQPLGPAKRVAAQDHGTTGPQDNGPAAPSGGNAS